MKQFFVAVAGYAVAGLIGVSFAQELTRAPFQHSGTQVQRIVTAWDQQ